MRIHYQISIAVAVITVVAQSATADLLVSDLAFNNWTAVFTPLGVFQDVANWYDVKNPLHVTQNNSVGTTESNANYSLAWQGNTAQFVVEADQTILAPQALGATVRTDGAIGFTPSVDTLVSFRVRYSYELPDILTQAITSAFVVDEHDNNLGEIAFVSNPVLDPLSGAIDRAMQVMVPAGGNYAFGFRIRLDGGGSINPAFDNGLIEMTLTPVPEPSAFFPLVLGVVMLGRYRWTTAHRFVT